MKYIILGMLTTWIGIYFGKVVLGKPEQENCYETKSYYKNKLVATTRQCGKLPDTLIF